MFSRPLKYFLVLLIARIAKKWKFSNTFLRKSHLNDLCTYYLSIQDDIEDNTDWGQFGLFVSPPDWHCIMVYTIQCYSAEYIVMPPVQVVAPSALPVLVISQPAASSAGPGPVILIYGVDYTPCGL